MMCMANGQVTTDELATMIKQGFDHVDKRFNKVEDDIDSLKREVEQINIRLDNVPYRFKLEALERRVDRLEGTT